MNTAVQLLVTGCYTEEMGGHGSGLTSYRRDPADGSLTPLGALALPSPSYVVRHPTLPLLYTANEADAVDGAGTVSVVGVATDGSLRELARVSSRGGWPCHLAVGEGGRRLAVANYRSGSVLFLDLDEAGLPSGGARTWEGDAKALGPQADRQDGPHAHMVVPGPDARWTVVDLGTDQLRSGVADSDDGPDAVTALPAGTGPRQLVRGADGLAYVVGELDARLHVLRETEPGRFTWLGAVAASTTATATNYPAHLSVGADRGLLLLSNRGADTVSVFRAVPSEELPRLIGEFACEGAWPRHLELVGEHLYVCDERSDTLVVFAVDATSGTLTALHRCATPSPTCALAIG
ncbi:6-phosphogluconolactonase [Streptacidiphilus sp. MAP12-33]|uniref:lactonase family protein n=1 Tax=Streptacidiphilus sp. MAP12-33 TaxID=3156266 RepID=UPI0035133221